MINGFSMYFCTTQCLPLLSLMYFKMSLYLLKTVMPLPRLAWPGLMIQRFLSPFMSNCGNYSFSFVRTFFVKSKRSGQWVSISIRLSLFLIFSFSLNKSLYCPLNILNHSLSLISFILAAVNYFLLSSRILHSVSDTSSPLHS